MPSFRVVESNYDSRWWALIYDQWNEEGDRRHAHEREFQFYRRQLTGVSGPVLEAACGTGSILLRLAQLGCEISGFDISEAMLEVLRRKAKRLGQSNIAERVSRQDFVDFRYEKTFAAILVPASAFMMLTTQEAQLACLRNIRDHLAPGGRLLLDFYIPSLDNDLLPHCTPTPALEEFGDFIHPETGKEIAVTCKKVVDLGEQTEEYLWYFAHDGTTEEVPMSARWIYKEEFQLLLRLAGYSSWQLCGSHDGQPYVGDKEMGLTYWVVDR